MPRLIWVFARRIATLLVLSCGGSFYICSLSCFLCSFNEGNNDSLSVSLCLPTLWEMTKSLDKKKKKKNHTHKKKKHTINDIWAQRRLFSLCGIRVSPVRMKSFFDHWLPNERPVKTYQTAKIDMQPDLSLRWAHMPFRRVLACLSFNGTMRSLA